MSIIHSNNNPIFKKIKWNKAYELSNTNIWDCAVGFEKNMYQKNTFQCISFQQKKAINIGKGGAILLDNKKAYKKLKRMTWDGRDSSISVKNDKNIILGYHMNMTPDDAAKGILILNQFNNENSFFKNYKNYPNISKLKLFKDFRESNT